MSYEKRQENRESKKNKNLKVKIEEGVNYYFFTTEEIVYQCIECKKQYLKRKTCLSCSKKHNKTVLTSETSKLRVGAINKNNLKEYGCSCFFSSTIMFSEFWQNKKKDNDKGYCKHYRCALNGIRKQKEK